MRSETEDKTEEKVSGAWACHHQSQVLLISNSEGHGQGVWVCHFNEWSSWLWSHVGWVNVHRGISILTETLVKD